MRTPTIKFATFIILMILVSNISAMDKNRIVLLKTQEPVISFRIWFDAGSKDDPKGKEGLAALTAALLNEGGTSKFTYSQILEKLYPLAAGYSASVSKENLVYTGSVHLDNLNEYLALFTEQLLDPGFREEDFLRVKDEAISYLSTTLRYSSDEELGKAVLYNEIFKGTPYGHLSTGTISSLKNITLDDVKWFYKKYFNKENYVLAIGGGFDDNLVQKVWDELQKLPSGSKNADSQINPSAVKGLNVVIVEKKTNATAISMGYPIDLLRNNDEWYPLALANSWLGEHRNSSSHLYQVIREARGLNYGDYSYIEYYPNGGRLSKPPVNVPLKKHLFEMWIRPVPNETKHFAFRAAMRELDLLVKNGLGNDDFEMTRKFLQKYVLHYAPNTEMRLGYALDDKYYGMKEPGHLQKFRNKMSNISINEVNASVKKYLSTQNMFIVFVTDNANDLKDRLIKNTSSPIVYQTPKPESVLKEDKFISDFKLDIKAENIKIVKVEDLFN